MRRAACAVHATAPQNKALNSTLETFVAKCSTTTANATSAILCECRPNARPPTCTSAARTRSTYSHSAVMPAMGSRRLGRSTRHVATSASRMRK